MGNPPPRSLPPHGGYRRLLSFRVATLAHDLTFRFCHRFVPRSSRTHDQMIQAARSGVQNIAEGSQVSGTSRSGEHRQTSVARASLEELRCDFWDYLRQRDLKAWPPEDPRRADLIAKRFEELNPLLDWIRSQSATHGEPIDATAANAALTLLAVACSLLDRQLASQARALQEARDAGRHVRRRDVGDGG